MRIPRNRRALAAALAAAVAIAAAGGTYALLSGGGDRDSREAEAARAGAQENPGGPPKYDGPCNGIFSRATDYAQVKDARIERVGGWRLVELVPGGYRVIQQACLATTIDGMIEVAFPIDKSIEESVLDTPEAKRSLGAKFDLVVDQFVSQKKQWLSPALELSRQGLFRYEEGLPWEKRPVIFFKERDIESDVWVVGVRVYAPTLHVYHSSEDEGPPSLDPKGAMAAYVPNPTTGHNLHRKGQPWSCTGAEPGPVLDPARAKGHRWEEMNGIESTTPATGVKVEISYAGCDDTWGKKIVMRLSTLPPDAAPLAVKGEVLRRLKELPLAQSHARLFDSLIKFLREVSAESLIPLPENDEGIVGAKAMRCRDGSAPDIDGCAWESLGRDYFGYYRKDGEFFVELVTVQSL